MDWRKESEMFNQTAGYYDQYRPSYPREMIDLLMKQAKLTNGSKLLEIGAGSGKATELFAKKGLDILCVEPGKDLVKLGNQRFSNEKFKFVTSRFEEYPVVTKSFDAIFAAQSFHWIPQPAGYEKCAYALKDGAYLALFWNMYLIYENEIDNELLSISKKYGGIADFILARDSEERVDSIANEIKGSRLFSEPAVFRYPWSQRYTADEYYGFALTGNRFIQKSDREKKEAHKEIIQLASKNKGYIDRPFLCVLYLSKKL